MILNTRKYLIQLLVVIVALYALHFLFFRAFLSETEFRFQLLTEMYLFLAVVSMAHFVAIAWLIKKGSKHLGFIFTGFILLKMGVSILYLLPYIFPSNSQSIVIALNFMGIYLCLLVYEVAFIAKSLSKIY